MVMPAGLPEQETRTAGHPCPGVTIVANKHNLTKVALLLPARRKPGLAGVSSRLVFPSRTMKYKKLSVLRHRPFKQNHKQSLCEHQKTSEPG
jgi:hypothetical protein